MTIPSGPTRADRPTLVQALKHYTLHRFDQHTPLPATVKARQIGSKNISADFTMLPLALNPQSVVLTVASKRIFLKFGDVIKRKGNTLAPSTADTVVFLLDNLCLKLCRCIKMTDGLLLSC